MLLHARVTVYPFIIAAGPPRTMRAECDGAWIGGAVAAGTEVLRGGRRDKAVVFYRDEEELAEQVSEYLLPAIQDGGVAIVVATAGHRRSFEGHLAGMGVDVAAASARGFLPRA